MKHDPAALDHWNGDTEELAGHEDILAHDDRLCDQVFASKREAFVSGLALRDARKMRDRERKAVGDGRIHPADATRSGSSPRSEKPFIPRSSLTLLRPGCGSGRPTPIGTLRNVFRTLR